MPGSSLSVIQHSNERITHEVADREFFLTTSDNNFLLLLHRYINYHDCRITTNILCPNGFMHTLIKSMAWRI